MIARINRILYKGEICSKLSLHFTQWLICKMPASCHAILGLVVIKFLLSRNICLAKDSMLAYQVTLVMSDSLQLYETV